MIPWTIATICGLVSALLVLGVGGIGGIRQARRNKDNRALDAIIGGVLALILMGLYVIVIANDGSFFQMLLGAGVAAVSVPFLVWLRTVLT